MDLVNFDAATRRQILDEINRDIAGDTLYMSPRLSAVGQRNYPELLLDAAESGDADSLAVGL